jgi:hypothetical protein
MKILLVMVSAIICTIGVFRTYSTVSKNLQGDNQSILNFLVILSVCVGINIMLLILLITI